MAMLIRYKEDEQIIEAEVKEIRNYPFYIIAVPADGMTYSILDEDIISIKKGN